MDKSDWRPVRAGHRYCSPACGGGCTWAAYEKATKAAARLAKKLGPQWKFHVWENLGWHYEVYCKGVQVYPSGTYYRCMVSDDLTSTSGAMAAWHGSSVSTKNPMAIVRLQLKRARAYVDELDDVVTAQETAIFGRKK